MPGYYRVTASKGLRARTGTSEKYSIKGAFPYNTLLYASDEKNGWMYCYKCDESGKSLGTSALNGWSSGAYLKAVDSPTGSVGNQSDEETTTSGGQETESSTTQISPIQEGGYSMYIAEPQSETYTIRNLMQIHGLPYQFLPTTDSRLEYGTDNRGNTNSGSDSALGRKYAEKIISTMPLLLLQPGTPRFMSDFKRKDKENFLERAMAFIGDKMFNDGGKSSLEDTLTRDGRYYSFQADWQQYYEFVDPMCRIAARYLGLQDHILNGQPLDKAKWSVFMNKGTSLFMNTELYGAIPFYINSETSMSESFSNDTTQSQLASTVNGISDMGREINFLLGYGSNALGTAFDGFNNEDINQNMENVNEIINKFLGKSSMLSNLAGNLAVVAQGGKMIFPEIWSDSSFSRSYNVTIKLVSPDSDKLSIYFNIIVPIIFLLCLCLPRSVQKYPNDYIAPFLVRGIYKGQYNIDMGIITDMSITRGGDEQSWTIDSLPTQAEVSFTIKDLYSALSITSMKNPFGFDTINNTALMDYIGNMCGINIYKPDVLRDIDIWYTQNFWAKVDLKNIGYELWNNCASRYQKTALSLYNKIFK